MPADHPARSMHDTFYVAAPERVRRRVGAAGPAHAHQPDADPLRAQPSAADQGDRAGQDLPRRFGRDPLADVPSVRGHVDRRGRELRRPEERLYRLPAPVLRARRHRRALPPVLLSLHRAVGRDRHALRRGAAARAAGSRSPAPGRSIRTSCATSASTRSGTSASLSARASNGWRCCAMASTTCGSSSRTTCASCASSPDAVPTERPPDADERFPRAGCAPIAIPRLGAEELEHRLTMVGPRGRGAHAGRAAVRAASSSRACWRPASIRMRTG